MGTDLAVKKDDANIKSVATFKQVYDLDVVEEALDEMVDGANEALRGMYMKMLKVGGLRFSVKPSSVPAMDHLYDDLPNFSEPLDDLRRQLTLCCDTEDRLELTPMLLLGDPGIGKTHFAKKLSKLIETEYAFIGMSSLTAGWVLSGASSQWKNAKPGKVFDTLVHGDYANPVIVIDEIDKASGDHQYDPLGALYTLLEHDTSKEFTDEFAEIPVDASDVIWIATANDARSIPDPILNRMNVYEIPPPDYLGSCRIAQSVYAEIRITHLWGERFPPLLEGDALEKIAALGPREMRRIILAAFGNARLDKRHSITSDDVKGDKNVKKRMGF